MFSLTTSAIVCSVRQHGEHGVIVRMLTPDHGLLAGYARGGRSRAMRPILMPGNGVMVSLSARTEDQLPGLVAELLESRAPLHGEPLPAAAIDWACVLTAAALPEGQPYPALFQAMGGLMSAIAAAPAAKGWALALVRYELLLLAELGFGLDLSRCVVSGEAEGLVFVSPRSAAAVSQGAAAGYEDRLLPLPDFVVNGGTADWPQIIDGLRLTGHFLERSFFSDRRAAMFASRHRLIDRIKRAVA